MNAQSDPHKSHPRYKDDHTHFITLFKTVKHIQILSLIRFLMSRDSESRIGSLGGFADVRPKRIKSEAWSCGEDISSEWRDTAPTSTETVQNSLTCESRIGKRRSSNSLSIYAEPDENDKRSLFMYLNYACVSWFHIV